MGVGGQYSRAAGMDVWVDSTLWSIVGVTEIFSALPSLLGSYWAVRQRLVRERPDLVVVIDSPALNMRLAGVMQRHHIRCVYYFPPSAWTRRERRLRQIHERADALITTFGFNAEQYRRYGLEVAHFGHPILHFCPPLERDACLRELGLPESGRYAALLPGSRSQEVRLLLPKFLEAARQIQAACEGLQWILPTANPSIEAQVRQIVGAVPEWLHIRSGMSRLAMAASEVGILASGTASLEASLLELPHILCYRLNRFDYTLGKTALKLGIIKVGHFGLPNLVLQRKVVPELLQDAVQPDAISSYLLPLLLDEGRRAQARAQLAEVRETLGDAQCVGRIAEFVARMAEGASRQEALRGL